MNNATDKYGLLIERCNSYGTEYVHARMVRREEGKEYPIGISHSFFDSDMPRHLQGLHLDGLGMRGFVSELNDFQFIGYQPEYRDVFSSDLPALKRMVRALDRVTRRIARDRSHEAGDTFASFCAALKLDFVVERAGPSRGSSFADNNWHWMTVTEGRNRYRQLIAETQDAVRAAQKRDVA